MNDLSQASISATSRCHGIAEVREMEGGKWDDSALALSDTPWNKK